MAILGLKAKNFHFLVVIQYIDRRFGDSISIEKDTLAIGTVRRDTFTNTGFVYIFSRENNTWSQSQKISSENVSSENYKDIEGFGNSVVIEDDHIFIGAYQEKISDNIYTGAVYVFTKNNDNWQKIKKIYSSDGERFDQFGSSLAIDENYLIIAAEGKTSDGKENSGAVYIYQK